MRTGALLRAASGPVTARAAAVPAAVRRNSRRFGNRYWSDMVTSIGRRPKLHAHGRADFGPDAGRRQRPGLRVDLEHDQAIAVLVGDDHPSAGRVDVEIP